MNFDFNGCWLEIQNGNEKALETLFDLLNKSLCLYSFNITNDLFASQEIIQDLFLKIWNDRRKIVVKGSFKAYLYQIAYNLSINYLVQRNTLKFSVNKLLPADAWLTMQNEIDINEFLIEKLEADDTSLIIEKAISGLPDQCKKIFTLSRFEGKSTDQIAALLNISVNTVRTQIYRALEKIKEELEK